MTCTTSESPLLGAREVHVQFTVRTGGLSWHQRKPAIIRAVDGVSFHLRQGEVLGLVGESGCGKSTLARALVRLEPVARGSIQFEGHDIARMNCGELRRMRPSLQMIFQDPYASLNPRMTVYTAVAEPLIVHRIVPPGRISGEVFGLLDKVGLARRHARKYPHEFSGGQRQRIAIARALALRPRALIADEPVSALDVSVQAQIINLLVDLQRECGMAMIFISHDLGVVRHVAQRIHVMYLGRIVETGSVENVFEKPRHPYTRALLQAVPVVGKQVDEHGLSALVRGEPPSLLHPPKGCRFHPRCPYANDACRLQDPALVDYGDNSAVACLRYRELP